MYKSSAYNIGIPLRGSPDILLFNTVTRAFAVLSPEDTELLQKLNEGFLPPAGDLELQCDRMILNGFAVPDDIDELARLEKMYLDARRSEQSLILTIAPTLSCNFVCDYCYQGTGKPPGKMDATIMDATVAYVENNLGSATSLHVGWYGGEPLMAFDVIKALSKRLMDVCDQRKVKYAASIITNGYKLTRPVARILEQCKVNVVQITLDGAQEFHDQRRPLLSKKGTYDRIVNNIVSWIDDCRFTISLRVNIDERNRNSVFELIDQLALKGLGGKKLSMYFAPVEATTSGCAHMNEVTMCKSEYAWLETSLALYACQKKMAGFPFPPRFMGLCGAVRPKALVIAPTGELHRCWDTVAFSHQSVGHILDTASLEHHPINQMWKNWSPFQYSSCCNCTILPTCAGACAYKFVHSTETQGEAASLPCPSWKFNIKEKLLHSAQLRGFITTDQIPDGIVTQPHEKYSFDQVMGKMELPRKTGTAGLAGYKYG
jgi:uncharacterized protein